MAKQVNKGRPVKNQRLHELMLKHQCSRTWAYKLLKKEATEAAARAS